MQKKKIKNSELSEEMEGLSETLLLTGKDFYAVSVRTRQELTALVRHAAKEIIHFDNLSIFLIDKSKNSHFSFFYYSREANILNDDFIRVKNSAYPVKDGFFDVTLQSDIPVLWDLAELSKWEFMPEPVLNCMSLGTKMIVGLPIADGKRKIGNAFWGYNDPKAVTPAEVELVQTVATSVERAVSNVYALEESQKRLYDAEIQLTLSNALINVKSKTALAYILSKNLKSIIDCSGFMFITDNSVDQALKPYILHYYNPVGIMDKEEAADPRIPTSDLTLLENVLSHNEITVWMMKDLMRSPSRPIFLTRHRTQEVKKIAAISLSENGEICGALFLFATHTDAFPDEQLRRLKVIAPQLSRAFLQVRFMEKTALKDLERDVFLATTRALMTTSDLDKIQQALRSVMSEVVFFDEGFIYFFQRTTTGRPSFIFKTSSEIIWKDSQFLQSGPVWEPDQFLSALKQVKESFIIDVGTYFLEAENMPKYVKHWKENGIKSMVVSPFLDNGVVVGLFVLLSRERASNLKRYTELINGIVGQISTAVNYSFANKRLSNQLTEINQLTSQLKVQNSYLQEEIRSTYNYSEMVGVSTVMRDVFHTIGQVASTDSTVLILGETGTGKELIARAIHNASPKSDKIMIKVNCAALPPNLIESELFGHERGSFTGATDRRIGKFELAHNSTIFLDEIGELPVSLQVKLLRVLQEKEIERVGGKSTIKVNVRVIAATNRNLLKEVQKGNFRGDLYFRLNAFPIALPPLRDRKEDVPVLINHFAQKYAKKKPSSGAYFSSNVIKQMTAYNWPGNVRELEHLVERSILLSKGKTITQVYLPSTTMDGEDLELINLDVKTIDEVERDHILSVLKMTDGKVSGVGGAAEMLKIPASTLASKIKKLKIMKDAK